MKRDRPERGSRRAITVMLALCLMVVILAMVAFGVDCGYMVLVRTQLQVAADSAAMAGAAVMGMTEADVIQVAQQYAAYHNAGGKDVALNPSDVEFGTWDTTARVFIPSSTIGNSVRVTAYRDLAHGGQAPLFFGRVLGQMGFNSNARAVAMANPRDICFVVDLSGSMNDDTEPAWSTGAIDSTFGSQGFSDTGSKLMQDVYADFGYGTYPGKLEWVGQPLGVKKDQFAYAELTKDGGPLAQASIATKYRVGAGDSEAQRKQKAYSWIIDNQIAKVMPNALPTASSTANYPYWESYLDYVIQAVNIKSAPPASSGSGGGGSGSKGGGGGSGKGGSGGSKGGSGSPGSGGGGGGVPTPPKPTIGLIPSPIGGASVQTVAMGSTSVWSTMVFSQLALSGPGQPPDDRGTIPAGQAKERIDSFNNPNNDTWPSVKASVPRGFRNQIGYLTYVQFMMDQGRDLKPDGKTFAPLSVNSAFCPFHSEATAGGTFSFPPREQPTHAARRALIAAMQVVEDRNKSIPDLLQRDWVSVVTFDTLTGGGPVVLQPLTGNYDAAMQACTKMQAVGDKGTSTATESGLITARKLLAPASQGGTGRPAANKVVVLLTDGVPNIYESPDADIANAIGGAGAQQNEFYNNGANWLDAPLMQTMQMETQRWDVYPVGLGLGTDYDFMDRLARLGGTANTQGQSPRGSGNPAQYEQRLTDIFEEIITNPQVRLVQ